ncbi:predicted cobalamin binding protein [Longilinea arvoryzae]|uniref:Predicted cobalamin binding protein n=1 Tax=Longilinea arvoryzae TaxID=360412 RepID=A0A0S7BPF1_9CHLR|nr:MerR family transcriptional regulator [Longilinea arvoryzae]GAP15701.1 predicted cobalamin binding protein [Longilinea arvoryzae]
MEPISRIAIYNLSAVMKETGLQPDVIRVWERRYGLPKPQRTAGGHRLYSEYDVATLKWLHARQIEGLSISRAVELWKELSAAGHDPLQGYLPTIEVREPAPPAEEDHLDTLRTEWLNACLVFDDSKAENTVNQAFGIASVETVCFEILQKGVRQMGDWWHQGQATVQQEHFATGLAIRRIDTLVSTTPNPTRQQTVLVGCPAGEWHSFPIRLLTLLLRRRGLNVISLGANIPLDQMQQTAASIRPDLVVLAAQQLTTAAALRSASVLFQQAKIPMAYGGLIFKRIPGLREKIPGFYLGDTLENCVERVEELLADPVHYPESTFVSETDLEIAARFRAKWPQIEMRLMAGLQEKSLASEYMATVNAFFAEGLAAALELGDPAWMENDLAWVGQLLTGRQISIRRLKPYLDAYREAIESEMGESGMRITGWLRNYLDGN